MAGVVYLSQLAIGLLVAGLSAAGTRLWQLAGRVASLEQRLTRLEDAVAGPDTSHDENGSAPDTGG